MGLVPGSALIAYLAVAVAAIDGAVAPGSERHLGINAALRANDRMHLTHHSSAAKSSAAAAAAAGSPSL